MITDAIKAKVMPWLVGGAFVLLACLVGTIVWLMSERDNLLSEVAEKRQALNQAAVTNSENQARIGQLLADAEWRDQKALERQRRNREMAVALADTQAELQEAMKDAPECVDQPWPDAVYDIMRRHTVSDPDRDRTGTGSG